MRLDLGTLYRRAGRSLLFAVAGVLGLAILATAALTARLAVGPVSVAFLGPGLREALGEKLYYAYDVKFDGLELRWSDGYGHTGLALIDVRVADYSLQDIASVPEIVVGLSPGAMLLGDGQPKAITVKRPKVRWIKTAGGAVKFDIGADKPGDSGKILEDVLITLAAAPDPEEGDEEKKALPELRVADAEILIGNELAESDLRIADADILIAPDEQGVRSSFELAVDTPGQPVHLSAEGLYRTRDQRIELAVRFADLALDSLGALLPSPVPQPILREALSGTVNFDMDKFFSVDATEFDLAGDSLSLAGSTRREAKTIALRLRGSLSRDSLNALREGWPSGLGREFDDWLDGRSGAGETVAVALEGVLGRFDNSLRLRGTLGAHETPFTVSGLAGNPLVSIPAEK
jgi:hypothetical protein